MFFIQILRKLHLQNCLKQETLLLEIMFLVANIHATIPAVFKKCCVQILIEFESVRSYKH
jgi:hypothetical protein